MRMRWQKKSPGGEPGPDAVGWLKTVATATLGNVILLPLGADIDKAPSRKIEGASVVTERAVTRKCDR